MFFLPSHIHYKQLLGAAVTKMERNGKVLKYYTFFKTNKQTNFKTSGLCTDKEFWRDRNNYVRDYAEGISTKFLLCCLQF